MTLVDAGVPAGGLEAQSGLAAITDALKAYRPGATVLEAQVSQPRGPLTGGATSLVTKRTAHGRTMQFSKRQKVSAQVTATRGLPDVCSWPPCYQHWSTQMTALPLLRGMLLSSCLATQAPFARSAAEAAGGVDEEAHELPGSEDRAGAPGAGPDALTASRHAAAAALALGEAAGGDSRFRESEFYISPVRRASLQPCRVRTASTAHAAHTCGMSVCTSRQSLTTTA